MFFVQLLDADLSEQGAEKRIMVQRQLLLCTLFGALMMPRLEVKMRVFCWISKMAGFLVHFFEANICFIWSTMSAGFFQYVLLQRPYWRYLTLCAAAFLNSPQSHKAISRSFGWKPIEFLCAFFWQVLLFFRFNCFRLNRLNSWWVLPHLFVVACVTFFRVAWCSTQMSGQKQPIKRSLSSSWFCCLCRETALKAKHKHHIGKSWTTT